MFGITMFNQSKKIKALQAELELTRAELECIKEKIAGDFDYLDDVAFDMAVACSIERRCVQGTDWYQTIVGYKNNKGVLHEWYFVVSDKKHKELVEQFNTSKNKVPQLDIVKLLEKYKMNDENGSLTFLSAVNTRLDAIIADVKTSVDEIDEEAYLKRAMETGAALFDNIIRAVREIKD